MPLSIVIRQRVRQRAEFKLPKVLQPLAGQLLLAQSADGRLQADAIHVVYGHGGERRARLQNNPSSGRCK
jgi:bifunctional N-acetylglucosamine-1-phosphate-uridyltransferase/glucosamine-1-phosphate-acetyltransferase GlmU-like protein